MMGMGLLPDRIFYTTIVDYLCKSGKIEMAHGVFLDMIEQGITPDVVSYNALINGLCKSSRVSEAMHLYEEMQTRGSHPDEVTFKLIIGGLIREKKLEIACSLWDQMMEKGFTLDNAVSDTLIKAIHSGDAVLNCFIYPTGNGAIPFLHAVAPPVEVYGVNVMFSVLYCKATDIFGLHYLMLPWQILKSGAFSLNLHLIWDSPGHTT
ncbi:hypothetical protein Pint_22843 [Pistacia integerrima]|uniref:Uncharacterized protein n=1 Tax=Pistacia integerrima TaxID=434235 RepID=A0ACC0YNU4_9ROSI|nr:hypothetical protein Pint_22843 [Pistacia integerrima]